MGLEECFVVDLKYLFSVLAFCVGCFVVVGDGFVF